MPLVDEIASSDKIAGFSAVKRDPESWAGAAPANQGLYLNENDKDSCGVGFICHIKGDDSHKIVSDARQLLCAMTHRGATGADSRDGDGAGVMTGIPHQFFKREAEREIGCDVLTHQKWSGADYMDNLMKAVTGGVSSTAAMGKGVTEDQFKTKL